MAATLRDAGFTNSYGDPDIWMRPNAKPDGFKYWEYVSTWVDDGMCISDKSDRIIEALRQTYVLNEIKGLFDEKPRYLGASVGTYDVNKSTGGAPEVYPFMSAEDYLEKVIPVVEEVVSPPTRSTL